MSGKTKHNLLWTVVNTCRLLVSITFVFSGGVKLVDPVGMQYKIEDYLAAFGIACSPDAVWPLLLAVALPLLEFLLGIYLFFGIRRRLASWTAFGFMLLYTPLTLWLALTNGVADCGCFGDAIHLTNWQTFWKNVALLMMTFIIWWKGRHMTRFISENAQWLISLYSLFYGLFVAGLCRYNEPIIDFRPYHIGQHIPSAMEWPDDPNATPEILDFNFFVEEEPEVDAQTVLADTSYTFLLISPHLEFADDGDMDLINDANEYARRQGYRFLALTASDDEAIHRWQDLTGADYPFAFMDELELKTMARSNPALLLLHDGTIVAKWPSHAIPTEELQENPLYTLSLAHPELNSYRSSLLRLLLWYLLPLFALTFIDRFVFSLKWWRRKRQTAKND